MREKDPKKVQKIFDATLSLVFHEGLDAINISKIAKSAKVASGTLYIYFENKEILLNELFDHVTDLWIDNIKLSVDSPDLEDHFRSIWKNHILFALNHYKAMHFKNIFIHSKYLDENNQEKSTKFLEIIVICNAASLELLTVPTTPTVFSANSFNLAVIALTLVNISTVFGS